MIQLFAEDNLSPTCSRKNCSKAASWEILWNNPKIHTPDRRKSWLSCDEHKIWLEDFLKNRQFWRETKQFIENI